MNTLLKVKLENPECNLICTWPFLLMEVHPYMQNQVQLYIPCPINVTMLQVWQVCQVWQHSCKSTSVHLFFSKNVCMNDAWKGLVPYPEYCHFPIPIVSVMWCPIDTMDAIFLANFESSEAMANGSMPPLTKTERRNDTQSHAFHYNRFSLSCVERP